MRAETMHGDPAQPPRREETVAHGGLVQEAPASVAPQRDALTGAERIWIGDVAFERHEPALAREDVLVLGLYVPERPEPERIDAEDACVPNAHEDRRRTLGEWPDSGTCLNVSVLQLAIHALHLVDDRREEHLDRLDRGQTVTDNERSHRRVDILRIASVA